MYTKEDVRKAADVNSMFYAESKNEAIKKLIEISDDNVWEIKYDNMDIYWDCPESYDVLEDPYGSIKSTKTNRIGIVLDKTGKKSPFFILWTDTSELEGAITNLIKLLEQPCYKNVIHTNYYKLLDHLNLTLTEVAFGHFHYFLKALQDPLRNPVYKIEEVEKIFTKYPINDGFLGPTGYSPTIDQIYKGLGLTESTVMNPEWYNNYTGQ